MKCSEKEKLLSRLVAWVSLRPGIPIPELAALVFSGCQGLGTGRKRRARIEAQLLLLIQQINSSAFVESRGINIVCSDGRVWPHGQQKAAKPTKSASAKSASASAEPRGIEPRGIPLKVWTDPTLIDPRFTQTPVQSSSSVRSRSGRERSLKSKTKPRLPC